MQDASLVDVSHVIATVHPVMAALSQGVVINTENPADPTGKAGLWSGAPPGARSIEPTNAPFTSYQAPAS